MKVLVVCALFAVATQGHPIVPLSVKPLSEEMINFINNLNTTWKATSRFAEENDECGNEGDINIGIPKEPKAYRE
ncbi:hypothetical protein MTO96_003889 [Rhipicephalus appendiculatus]